MNLQEARTQFLADKDALADKGVHLNGVVMYATPEMKRDSTLAMDAQPVLQTAPSGGIPALLTTTIDPNVIRVRFSPTKAAEILGEQQKGDWRQDTIAFGVIEHTGEVSSYGDYANNGSVNANMNWPQRQLYRYQTISEYGELEVERAGLAGINLVAEKDAAAATVMGRFENTVAFFGIAGLQTYGITNDPALGPALTPATKAAGGTTWFTTGGAPNATANEVYNDFLSMFAQLVNQTAGLVEATDRLVWTLSPPQAVALGFINQYNVKVREAIQAEFPNLRIVTAVQYGKQSAQNPMGLSAGNMTQLIAETIDGQETGFSAYAEKMRTHNVVPDLSSWKKKWSGATWGAVMKLPYAVVSMVGI